MGKKIVGNPSKTTSARELHSADGSQKYEIIKSIDEEGQTSQVYLARAENGTLVALKVYNKNFQDGLESEVKSLARLNNSHMVRILNHGQDGRFYGCKKANKKRLVVKNSKPIKKRVIRLRLKGGSSTASSTSNLSQN